ncbi:metallopeptidase M24 family protein [Paraburkholderia xenovorans LB400]|jgi:Xaa-Pro aminopeptidase|uniref:Hydrolase/peptidase, M24 family n=1 Tax=Paraburkholderia xenovorans (strain LB400) TaxID=266265 RepID=Q13ZY2_PARXL|nr:M24 family metallopeptidase [Paraburkholderia xenovorans]ABE30327.1 Putative hydrolase/peptidase, M24 family [Paraburkholderia xenovorans LB400]ABE30357.1 Putative hydrolase/peptidase, M24 family [Paraburkholderia xenovorans LB400]AIP31102.1 metallopeptidase M24 family protein [Paraburkholderia xenovorans LB400]
MNQRDFPSTLSASISEEARAVDLTAFVPQLSLEERDRRWDRARKKMLMAGLDALVFLGNDIYWGMGMANMRYMLQVDSQIGADALFPLVGDPVVWNAVAHMNRPTNMYLSVQKWIRDFRTRGGMTVVADELRQRGLGGARIGLVGFSSTIQTTPTLLHEDVLALKRLLPNAEFQDASALLQEMRMVKSEEEIDMLRGAGRIARKVIDAMVETARPGVPDAAVYAEMIRTQIANGGEPNIFNLFAAGPVDHPTDELWHLLHGCEQPLTPTMRPLQYGDIIVTEWHTKYGGYRCHTEFSVYIGKKAPRELLNIWAVSHECLEASKEALVAGRTIGEAIQMIRKPAQDAKLDWVELGFHAMGTASPEFPTVIYQDGYGSNTLNGNRIADMVLEEGMTFGNNIDLHNSAWKPDVGCMLSDFMVVRPKQAECLIGVPKELPQVG